MATKPSVEPRKVDLTALERRFQDALCPGAAFFIQYLKFLNECKLRGIEAEVVFSLELSEILVKDFDFGQHKTVPLQQVVVSFLEGFAERVARTSEDNEKEVLYIDTLFKETALKSAMCTPCSGKA